MLVGVTEAEVLMLTSLVGVHNILYRLRSTGRPCTAKEERTIRRNGSNSSSGVAGRYVFRKEVTLDIEK